MSWLNSSLNSLKGQLHMLTQEVLADDFGEQDEQYEQDSKAHIDELNKLCDEQNKQITILKKQISELQVKQNETENTKLMLIEKNVALEDSWCWEPDNGQSAASNKTDNAAASDSSLSGEMVRIPLDLGSVDQAEPERDGLTQIERDNLMLSEKVQELVAENSQLNESLEELDAQHNVAMQKLLDIKTEWQIKYNDLEIVVNWRNSELEILQNDYDVLQEKFQTLLQEYKAEKAELIKSLALKDENLTDYTVNMEGNRENFSAFLNHLLEYIQSIESDAEYKPESNNYDDNELFTEMESKFVNTFMALKTEKDQLKTKNFDLSEEILSLKNFSCQEQSSDDTKEWQTKYLDMESNYKGLNLNLENLLNEDAALKSKIEELEKEIVEITEDRENQSEEIVELKDELNTINDQWNVKIEKLMLEKEQMENELDYLRTELESKEAEIKLLGEKIDKCQSNASDVESKLMMETVTLQKKVIDLESIVNQRSVQSKEEFSGKDNLKDYLNGVLAPVLGPLFNAESIEASLESVKSKLEDLEKLQKQLEQTSDELNQLNREKTCLEHERNSFKSDVMHYEVECSELMKNNEILLNELENYKSNKLETIPENNEESIIVLEKQLEECNSINRALEDEYNTLYRKFEVNQSEKKEILKKVETLQETNKTFMPLIKDLNNQKEILETEKCNLIFEINEMKTDDKKSAMESEMYDFKNKNKNLEVQLELLNKDHSDLVLAMQNVQKTLTDQKKESKMKLTSFEHQIAEKDNRINELEILLKQIEMDGQRSDEQDSVSKIQLEKLNEEKLLLESELSQKGKDVTGLLDQNSEQTSKIVELESQLRASYERIEQLTEFEKRIGIIEKEKEDIIGSLGAKHTENMQYYAEIQRLNTLLQEEVSKDHKIEAICPKCSDPNQDERIKLKDQISFLREKSDILQSNLLSEQTNQKLLREEKSQLEDANSILRRDLDRLREHLVELEAAHTKESLQSQNLLDEAHRKISHLEENVYKASNAYTSASIRANQHTETLQTQYTLLTQQRDELAQKLSLAEDREFKNQAALTNLQCALEQFQKEKESDILAATSRLRLEMEMEKRKELLLKQEIIALKQQLTDANQGLLAASRLSDQLELNAGSITHLNEENEKLQKQIEALKTKLETVQNQSDQVEKSLIKSLIIGYHTTNNQNDKLQILKIISTVLDFSSVEIDKVGLTKIQTGWLSSTLFGGNNKTDTRPRDNSLVQAFVSFLEQESQPKADSKDLPNLLSILDDSSPGNSKTENQRRDSNTNINPTSPSSHNQSISSMSSHALEHHFPPTRNSSSILKDILNSSP